MSSAPEFARPVRLDTIGSAARSIAIEAQPEERAALAERFGLIAIDRLTASIAVKREGPDIFTEGRLRAHVVQPCIATAEPVPADIDEPFLLRFVSDQPVDAGEEIELSANDCDVVFYEGSAIDLGEAVAETLSLALDPFPRSANADAVLREAGVRTEEEAAVEASPFAKLKGLIK